MAITILLVLFDTSFADPITYAYDDLNRLSRASSSGAVVEYVYDEVGNLIQKKLYTASTFPASYNFGSVGIDTTSTQTFTLTNTGTETVQIGTTGFDGNDGLAFSTANDNCAGSTLAPSANCTLQVSFSPSTTGGNSANLAISFSNPDTLRNTIPLSGTGSEAEPPDLFISTLTVPVPYTTAPGGNLPITEATKNVGFGPATASMTTFYLSTSCTDALIYVGSRDVGALSAGETDGPVTTTISIPVGTPLGMYYVIAKADDGSAVPVSETREDNNTKCATTSPITIAAGDSDLVVTYLDLSTTQASPGAAISATDITKNRLAGTAGASTTAFYLSGNSTCGDADDVRLIGDRSVPSLSGNETSTGTTSVTIPGSTAVGTYYVCAKADDSGAVTESDEGNNFRISSAISVVTYNVDLAIFSWYAPTYAKRGTSISVTDGTKNRLADNSGASITAVYLSTNATLDGEDILLGSRSVPALGGGAQSTGTISVTIPPETAAGSYYIIWHADDGNVVPETDETNNTKYRTITITN